MAISTFILTLVGGFVTSRIIKPKLEKQEYIIPADMNFDDFTVKPEEDKALAWAGIGLLVATAIVVVLGMGPLASYVSEEGKKVTPFLNNIILIITFLFFVPGLFYGVKVGMFKKADDVVKAMSKSMSSMGAVIVLTFFSYNFLALLSQSQLGTYITYLGATALQSMGLSDYPILLIIGFIIVTAIINLFVGGMTSKWMLLGPIFVPMLYQVNNHMTPDIVAAAYRVADSSTNIITPLMSYAGLILVFMRKYKPEYSVGDLVSLMFPYSITFLVIWSTALIGFFTFGLSLGF
ncbi:AbgT family transporter [Cellulosilyticum ruminicola]|uniref:AbgT family transporter n=1 Tax=Cellulosilyticum ruminicola TaxID=425254 RepID=UPI000A60F5A3|nr:AbgT family transporter [Cellulosilyticum ruminicola]